MSTESISEATERSGVSCLRSCAIALLGLAVVVALFWAGCASAARSAMDSKTWRGAQVRALGDIDRDGIADFALASPSRASVWIVSGHDGAILRTIAGGRDFGFDVAAASDEDHDGAADLWIADPLERRAELYSTGSGQRLRAVEIGERAGQLGWALATLDDRDGDGERELVLGVPQVLGQEAKTAGSVRIFGRAGARLRTLTAPVEFAKTGARFGGAVSSVPDIDGDGHEELAVLVAGWQPAVLSVLSSRSDGETLRTYRAATAWSEFAVTLASGAWLGTQGPVIAFGDTQDIPSWVCVRALANDSELLRVTGSTYGAKFGSSLLLLGDLDGDGNGDLGIGEPGTTKAGALPMGVPLPAWLAGSVMSDVTGGGSFATYSGVSGKRLWTSRGSRAWDWLGCSSAPISDIDGDGVDELVIAGESGFSTSERKPFARVVSGRSGNMLYEVHPH